MSESWGKTFPKVSNLCMYSTSVVRVMCGTGKQSAYLFIQMLADHYFNQQLCNASAIMLWANESVTHRRNSTVNDATGH